MKIADIQEKTLVELRDIARSMNLTGFSLLRKQDLVDRIVRAQSVEEYILILPLRSAQRQPELYPKAHTALLNPFDEKSDKQIRRLSQLMKQALGIFGSKEKARKWFWTPLPALGGKTPLECAETEDGAQKVEDMLGRIAHGVFS